MLYTYTFTNIPARNTFINIVKELWFSVITDTYTEVKSSKSEVKDHILWNGRDVSTVNQTIVRYEINIEKEMTDADIKNFNNFIYYYFNKQISDPDIRIKLWILWWFWSTLLFWWLLAVFFKYIKIPYLTSIYNINTYKYLMLLWMFIFFSMKFLKSEKPIAAKKTKEIDEKNKKIKDFLMKKYLWEYWKKIISNM